MNKVTITVVFAGVMLYTALMTSLSTSPAPMSSISASTVNKMGPTAEEWEEQREFNTKAEIARSQKVLDQWKRTRDCQPGYIEKYVAESASESNSMVFECLKFFEREFKDAPALMALEKNAMIARIRARYENVGKLSFSIHKPKYRVWLAIYYFGFMTDYGMSPDMKLVKNNLTAGLDGLRQELKEAKRLDGERGLEMQKYVFCQDFYYAEAVGLKTVEIKTAKQMLGCK